MIETKTSTNYKTVAKIIENDFFKRYFGDFKELHKIVKSLLLKKEIKIALEINKAIKVLGSGASKDIIRTISNKYGKKIINTNSDVYLDQSETIKRKVKNFQFEGDGDEQDYVYNFKYDDEEFIVNIIVQVFLNGDDDHEKPYPVVNFEINLKEKHVIENNTILLENYFYYEQFNELIDYLEEELEKNT